jgi:hypothetical protein
MIIHAYFTDGYYPWADFFVRTLKHSNGEDNKLIVSSRNLNKNQIKGLKDLYKNIEVRNKDLDYQKMAKRAKVSLNELMVMKKQVETIKINKTNRVWKLMTSAEDRIKEIRDVHNSLPEGEHFLNMDIDTYIRHPLDPWFKIVRENDFTSIFRIEKQMREFGYLKREDFLIICCIQGYTISKKTTNFLNKWVEHIDSLNPPERSKGWGQTTCYRAYDEVKEELKWGNINPKTFSLTGVGEHHLIWGANKGSKTENLKRFKQDFKRRQ